jgi:transposase
VPIDPTPRFKVDQEKQCDVVWGHLDSQVSEDHLVRAVWSIAQELDTSGVEQNYSALGQRGYAPRRLLALWLYASLAGEHEASKVARRCKTDAAFRWACGGRSPSAATLKRFRQRNGALFADALACTVKLAMELGLVDTDDVAVDSVRLRAHASRDAVRTASRSSRRLGALRTELESAADAMTREALEGKIRKHEEALARCQETGRTNVVLTNESAGLIKFPHGTSAPGHRVTVAASGLSTRILLSVLIDATSHDYGHLVDTLRAARDTLRDAGWDESCITATADAGYFSTEDLCEAAKETEWLDVVVAPSSSKRQSTYFGRDDFTVPEQGPPTCPAGTLMEGPTREPQGKQRWTGVGCGDCALRAQCTGARARTLTIAPALEAMRRRFLDPDVAARYRRRIGIVEPVFAKVEHVMRFQRLSSRDPETVKAEILLKFLAYNVSRLIRARRLAVLRLSVSLF